MPEPDVDLDLRNLRPSSETISVYVRHRSGCKQSGDPHSRRCDCPKYIYELRNGKKKTYSAKTRSWSVAEKGAAVIRDSWDPVKKKLKELEEAASVRETEATTIDSALEAWLTVVINNRKIRTATISKSVTAAKLIGAWARRNSLVKLHQITPHDLEKWTFSWGLNAELKEDRIRHTTAGRRLEQVKKFLIYCMRMGWIDKNPAVFIEPIPPDESITLPLLSGRYEAVLTATYSYDRDMRPDDRFGVEMRALFGLMRWTGMRIGDALAAKRSGFTGNSLRFRLQKHRKKKWHTVIVPDSVIAALFALPPRETVDPNYFFWSGKSLEKSLTGQWQRKIARLNDYLNLIDDEGNPMRFHSHQLRDTFAVTHLISGTSMQDVSKMLAHKSTSITEKYYTPWGNERQVLLEQKMAEGLVRMGATVSFASSSASHTP